MQRLLKEPLFHFLVAGVGLFVLFGVVNEDDWESEDPKVVIVDRDALMQFVQFRTKAFEPTVAAKRLDALSETELQRLINDYVREEVLHREALALGLGDEDYVIRRRLVQKVEFVTEGFAEASTALDDQAVERFFEKNKQDYYVEPYVTFAHVFFDAEEHGPEQALTLATEKLAELNKKRALFSDAPGHGDRFLYHVNYVERTPEFVASHFGVPMAKAVFELEPDDEIWKGPFQSPYGAHVVMVSNSQPGRDPTLDEIKGRIVDDAQRADVRERTEGVINDIVESYDVRIEYEGEPK